MVARVSERMSTLLTYTEHPHAAAGDGAHGGPDLRTGGRGDDYILELPPGTVVRDSDGTLIADLVEHRQQVELLHGGRGGRGNAALVSVRNRAPNHAEQGEYGEAGSFDLELKLVADAAIVGFPNAGKSTLISAVSAAKPKIAEYPFTTTRPHLGVVMLDDRELVLADIPGLIEGAAEGKGLGREFLRHTERARVLLLLLDPTQAVSISEQDRVLSAELEEYSPELAARARVVAVNKTDVLDPSSEAAELARAQGFEVHLMSAVRGDGLAELVGAVADAVEQAEAVAPDRDGYVLHRPVEETFTVAKEDDVWVVSGRAASRAVRLSDLTDPSAASEAARRLSSLGVDEALRAAGAQPGDEVRIGDLTFVFEED